MSNIIFQEEIYQILDRITKIIQRLRNLTYKDRVKYLNLHSLERRSVRGDLIEMFKWVKDFNRGDINTVLI